MITAIDQLPDDIKTLKEIIVEGFTHRDQENALLKEQIRLLQALLYGRKTEKLQSATDEHQLRLNFGEEPVVEPAQVVTEEKETKVPVKGHSRRKGGRKLLPAEFPRIENTIDVSDAEKLCECGCMKTRIGEETSEHLEHVPAAWTVIVNIRPKYACRNCEGTESEGPAVAIAPVPEQIIPKSIATASLLALIIVSKFVDALPFYRQSNMFARNGVDLSRGTMCSWATKVAALLKPMIEVFIELIIQSPVINADETRIQVLKEADRKAKSHSWMWVFRGGGSDRPTILFHYHQSRAGKVAENILRGHKGFIQTDGHSGYNFIEDNPDQVNAGCWAHSRRKFFDAVKAAGENAAPGMAHEAINIIRELYKIEKEAQTNNLDSDQILKLRQAKAKPVLDEFKKKLDKWQLVITPKSLTGKAINYTLNQWEKLIVYVSDGRLAIDNNSAENSIRPFAVGRKNWLFNDSVDGATAAAIFFSVLETAKANGLEPYWYMRFLLEKLTELKTKEDFLPFIPQKIDKQLVLDLRAKHMNLNSTN
jgi:transposase